MILVNHTTASGPTLPPKVGFIGIGAQKSATSWLHAVLSEHPSICPGREKELNFFTANFDRGYLWYEGCFPDFQPRQLKGECSPTYFFNSDAADRAKAYNPDMRIIAVLRDPVARAFSNHLHEIRKRHIPEETSFDDALATNPAYVLQSRYKENLCRWVDAFGREAVLVLFAEDIANNPLSAYRQVCEHLGLGAEPVPVGLSKRRHESVARRSRRLEQFLRGGGDLMRKIGLGKLVEAVKSAPPVRTLLRLNDKDLRLEVPPMAPETRMRLALLFKEDMAYVAELTGRQSLPWPSWQALATSATGKTHSTPEAHAHAS